MTTFAEMKAIVRQGIQESTANEWDSTTQVGAQVKLAYEWFAKKLGSLRNANWFEYREEITLAADATSFDLTTLTKRFFAVKTLEFQLPGGQWSLCPSVDEMDDAQWEPGIAGSSAQYEPPPYQKVGRATLRILRASGSARTLRIKYQYLPTALSGDSDVLETPSDYDNIIKLRAVTRLLPDEGEDDPVVAQQLDQEWLECVEFEQGAHARSVGETVNDETMSHLFR